MLGLERKIVFASALFIFAMIALLAYSIYGLGVRLPGCVTISQAFTKGEFIQKTEHLAEVHVVARMWTFEPSVIKVKPNTTLDIYLASLDVNHGFHLENTNVNLMAVPGAINYARVTLRDPGVYHITCHEYCGVGHQSMAAAIVVEGDEDSGVLLQQTGNGYPNVHGGQADLPGKTLYAARGCIACHSIDGVRGTGPSFKGLYGRKEKMSDGKIVSADDAYIIESIKEPAAKIVDGFQPVMPKLPVTDEEISHIINYIKTLKE